MSDELFKLASSQGIWATLSIVLIFYILKAQERRDIKQEEREIEYQKIIVNLTEKFEIIRVVLDHVSDIKSQMK